MNTSLRCTLITLLALDLAACNGGGAPADPHDHGHDGGHAHEHAAGDESGSPAKGAHGGRLLDDGDFRIELAIFEAGVPPEYRAWASLRGQPLPPQAVQLTVELARLGGDHDRFSFTPQDAGYLRGSGVVAEPHSFDVAVTAEHAGQVHRWAYASHEGRVNIPAASAEAAGIGTAIAGPRLIHDVLPLYGRIAAAPDAVREVGARFPGVIRSVSRAVGDPVKAGQTLARVESNDSLQEYSVVAPISGIVTARHANPGETAGAEALFTITDLSRVGAELSVFPRDLARVRVGQELRLKAVDGNEQARARVLRLAPAAGGDGQSLKLWAQFEPGQAPWTPGLYVSAELLTGGAEVPLAVQSSGLQGFRDFTVVFARVGEDYEVRMLELGRSDGEYVEVLGGLKPGTEYVSRNSYLIKADIEKSGASHDH